MKTLGYQDSQEACTYLLLADAKDIAEWDSVTVLSCLEKVVEYPDADIRNQALARLYKNWDSENLLQESGVIDQMEDLAFLLGKRKDISLAVGAFRAMDEEMRVGILQNMVDFAFGFMLSGHDLVPPRVVVGHGQDHMSPLLPDVMQVPDNKDGEMEIRVNPVQMDNFRNVASLVMSQVGYHVMRNWIAMSSSSDELMDPDMDDELAKAGAAASILFLNGSEKGYVPNFGFPMQPVDAAARQFGEVACKKMMQYVDRSVDHRSLVHARPSYDM